MFRLLIVMLLLSLVAACSTSSQCHKPPALRWADTRQLKLDLDSLTAPTLQGRKTGTSGAALSREYLAYRFEQVGLEPWLKDYRQAFTYSHAFSEKPGINMVGVIRAKVPSDRWRVIVAHYDHLGKRAGKIHPGADDNASGVAALLQLAQQAKRSPGTVNLLFVATDAEEPGLFGGYALVKKLASPMASPQLRQIELLVNMDMIGRPDKRNAIYLEGARAFEHYEQIERHMLENSGLCIRTHHPRRMGRSVQSSDWLRASDHYPFHKANIPWLYFGVPPHADYHAPTDTVKKIDLKFLAAVTESAYQLLIIDSLLLENTR